jgi:hypothetical protein
MFDSHVAEDLKKLLKYVSMSYLMTLSPPL